MASIKTVLIDGETFQFKDIILHGTLEQWNDVSPIRLANHKYLKRNGGEVEPMGADQRKFSFKCVFLDQVTNRYKQLESSIFDDPRGLLIHPRFGKVQVACEVLQAKEDPANAKNALDFTISFIEDSVDSSLNATTVSPQARIAAMQGKLTNLTVLSNGTSIAGTAVVLSFQARFLLRDVIAKFISISNSFIQFANSAAASVYQVPALINQLRQVKSSGDATISYIKNLAISIRTSDSSLWPLIDNVKQTQSLAQDTYNAILLSKPPIVTFTVPSTMSVRTIAVLLYGKDAQSKVPEILLLNTIFNPGAVSMGTILKVSSPTVPQVRVS